MNRSRAGWIRTKLGDVIAPSKDKADPKELPNEPYVGLEHVEANTMRLIGHGLGADVESTKSTFRKGDVLYGKLRPYLNKVAQPDFGGICSTDFLVFAESERLDRNYLAQYLNQAWLVEAATQASRGVQLPRVNWEFLANLPVSFPPDKAEQRAIASLLRDIRDRKSHAQQHLIAARHALDEFRKSVVTVACEGKLTSKWRLLEGSRIGHTALNDVASGQGSLPELPNRWSWMTPEELRRPDRSITYGVIKLGAPLPGGVPTLRSSDVRMLLIDESGVKAIAKEIADNYARTYLEGGEVLVTVRGTLGGVAVAQHHMRGWNISREVAMIPVGTAALSEYVALAIASRRSQQWMNNVTKGVTYTGINIRDLKRLPLPIPPIAEQKQILKQVERLFSLGDSVAERIDSASRTTEGGANAAVARAFEGAA